MTQGRCCYRHYQCQRWNAHGLCYVTLLWERPLARMQQQVEDYYYYYYY